MDCFTSLIGQNRAVELLTQAVERNRIAPGYLFVGSNGIGKSLAAQCFIELLFSVNLPETKLITSLQNRVRQRNHPDLLWVEPTYMNQGKRLSTKEAEEAGLKRKAPPQIRLEQIREISQFLSRPPLEAARSVVVLEQAETMGEGAANGLLKTLEEPGKAALILIAPTVEALLPTLISRCQKIQFSRLNPEAMTQVLQQAGFAVLKAPDIPSILVETAFISNPNEEKRLKDKTYQGKLADAITEGIVRYFDKNPPLARTATVASNGQTY